MVVRHNWDTDCSLRLSIGTGANVHHTLFGGSFFSWVSAFLRESTSRLTRYPISLLQGSTVRRFRILSDAKPLRPRPRKAIKFEGGI
jgi:hypothetical protein